MTHKTTWITIEEWEFQKILKELAEGAKTGRHTLAKKHVAAAAC